MAGDLARPMDWALKEEAEQRFSEAEEVRLLYDAVGSRGIAATCWAL